MEVKEIIKEIILNNEISAYARLKYFKLLAQVGYLSSTFEIAFINKNFSE